METALTKEPTTQVVPQATTPDQLLALAINKDLDIDKLAKLMELQREYNADLARKAFFTALMEFQSVVPEIRKNKKVSFTTQSGGKTEYFFAPLADVVRQIKDACKECGLSYRWEINDTKEEIKVTCLVTHVDGHTERTTTTAAPDGSGSKNQIQARGSAIEYLKRYTLIGALGLSTADSDVDGMLPEISLDLLHRQYMEHYNDLIQIDQKYTKWHPDNWKGDNSKGRYIRAISEIRKKLTELTPKEA